MIDTKRLRELATKSNDGILCSPALAAADYIDNLTARVAECDADKALLFQCEDWLERADKARLEAVAERDTLKAENGILRTEKHADAEAIGTLTARVAELEAKNAKMAEGLIHLRGAYDCADVVDAALKE